MSMIGADDKRNVDPELNLVPYIDLLSTLIAFLLLTSVWYHINALSIRGGELEDLSSVVNSDQDSLELTLSIYIDKVVAQAGKQGVSIEHVDSNLNIDRLKRVLSSWRQAFPERKDVVIYTDSRAPYRDLITAIDHLFAFGFEDIGIDTE